MSRTFWLFLKPIKEKVFHIETITISDDDEEEQTCSNVVSINTVDTNKGKEITNFNKSDKKNFTLPFAVKHEHSEEVTPVSSIKEEDSQNATAACDHVPSGSMADILSAVEGESLDESGSSGYDMLSDCGDGVGASSEPQSEPCCLVNPRIDGDICRGFSPDNESPDWHEVPLNEEIRPCLIHEPSETATPCNTEKATPCTAAISQLERQLDAMEIRTDETKPVTSDLMLIIPDPSFIDQFFQSDTLPSTDSWIDRFSADSRSDRYSDLFTPSSTQQESVEDWEPSEPLFPPITRKRPQMKERVFVEVTGSAYWKRGRVADVIVEPDQPVKYEIKFDYIPPVMATCRSLAYWRTPKVPVHVGYRVLARRERPQLDHQDVFYPGVVLESPKTENRDRYLIFFDTGDVLYVKMRKVRLVCGSSDSVWENICEQYQDFIRSYLEEHPNHDFVVTSPGDIVKARLHGEWRSAEVIRVDCSIAKVELKDDKQEWVLRDPNLLVLLTPSPVIGEPLPVEEPQPVIEEPLAMIEDPLPEIEEPLSTIKERLSMTEERLPVIKEPLSMIEDPLPEIEEPLSTIKERLSMTEERLPVIKEPLPIIEDPLPEVEEPVSIIKERLSITEEHLPVIKEPSPMIEDPLPVLEEPLSMIKGRLSTTEELVPVIKKSPLMVKISPSVVEDPPPMVKVPPSVLVESQPVIEEEPSTSGLSVKSGSPDSTATSFSIGTGAFQITITTYNDTNTINAIFNKCNADIIPTGTVSKPTALKRKSDSGIQCLIGSMPDEIKKKRPKENPTTSIYNNVCIINRPQLPFASKKFPEHHCGPDCIKSTLLGRQIRESRNPLAVPVFNGWRRKSVKLDGMSVMYTTPCGRKIFDMEGISRYLSTVGLNLTLNMFSFDFEVDPVAAFVYNTNNVVMGDISFGTEKIKIAVYNVDMDRGIPDFFRYIKKYSGISAKTALRVDPQFLPCCDCEDDCTDKTKCLCRLITMETMNNPDPGEGYQYRRLRKKVETGIVECNKRCKCSKSCLNRVAQNEFETRVQIFKTAEKGWGVRALYDIPRGSFICTYAGDLLSSEEADKERAKNGNDYFIDLDHSVVAQKAMEGCESRVNDISDPEVEGGSHRTDCSSRRILRQGAAKLVVGVEKGSRFNSSSEFADSAINDRSASSFRLNNHPDEQYVVNSKHNGNVSRFFNHSCHPNMFVQNVFIDNLDFRFPTVAFFAKKRIAAGRELTWDYGYRPGSVSGKMFVCKCKSVKCRGRFI